MEASSCLFTRVVAMYAFFSVASYNDGESEGSDEEPTMVLHGTRRCDGKRVQHAARDAASLAQAALGETPVKACAHCREVKPLAEFSHSKDTPDGRLYRCLECERERVKLAMRQRRAK